MSEKDIDPGFDPGNAEAFAGLNERYVREYLQRPGFRSIATHRLAHDIQNNWYMVTK